MRQEKDSLTQQLLNTIKHKVVLSQELDAWQVSPCAFTFIGKEIAIDSRCCYRAGRIFPSEAFILLQEDMRFVINQQVQQKEEERQKEKVRETAGLQRSKSLRVEGEGGKGFFSFFKEKK